MAAFSETIAAYLGKQTVNAPLLCFLDFVDNPTRVWSGFGKLKTNDGNIWSGLGEFVSVEGLSASIGTGAQSITLSLSGVDPSLVAVSKEQSTLVKGRTAVIYLQFCDENWKCLDNPVAIKTGTMDVMTYRMDAKTASISLTVEGRWTGRRRPQLGLWSDANQKKRYPGDRGLELMAGYVNKVIDWPTR